MHRTKPLSPDRGNRSHGLVGGVIYVRLFAWRRRRAPVTEGMITMTSPYPQQAPYGHYPQPAKKRKWPWIVAGLVAFLVAAPMLSSNDKKTDNTPSRTTTAAPAAPEKPEPRATLNSSVRDDKFEFVVKTVQPGLAEVGDNPYLYEKAQGIELHDSMFSGGVTVALTP